MYRKFLGLGIIYKPSNYINSCFFSKRSHFEIIRVLQNKKLIKYCSKWHRFGFQDFFGLIIIMYNP